jgi:hypothetical protein
MQIGCDCFKLSSGRKEIAILTKINV